MKRKPKGTRWAWKWNDGELSGCNYPTREKCEADYRAQYGRGRTVAVRKNWRGSWVEAGKP